MALLYLARHGETEFNWAGRLQGRMDSPLTDHGRQQAHQVGEKLKEKIGAAPVTLWVSPLGRAKETAKIVRPYLTVSTEATDKRLAEIALGAWEGMTMEDIEFTHPGALDGRGRFDWAYQAPDGETEVAFRARLNDWLNEVSAMGALHVVISHGWAGMGLRSVYTAKPFEQVSAVGDPHEAVFEFFDGQVIEF